MSTEYFTLKRDHTDHIARMKRLSFDKRHDKQQDIADIVDTTDQEWLADKNAVDDLNKGIMYRRQNYKTYKDAIYAEEVLYNKERHRTIFLGMANVVALAACVYVWLG